MEDKLKWDTKKCSRDPQKKARKGNKRKKTKVTADNNKTVGLKKKTKKNQGGMFRENSIETCILSRVKQMTSPGWMHETSARTWCTGKTQSDRVESEVGGGDRDGEYM